MYKKEKLHSLEVNKQTLCLFTYFIHSFFLLLFIIYYFFLFHKISVLLNFNKTWQNIWK